MIECKPNEMIVEVLTPRLENGLHGYNLYWYDPHFEGEDCQRMIHLTAFLEERIERYKERVHIVTVIDTNNFRYGGVEK